MIKAIIFDKDGVLVDSTRVHFGMIQKVAARFGVKIEDELMHPAAGLTLDNTLKTVLHNHLTPEQGEEVKKEIATNYSPNVHLLAKPISTTVEFIKNYQGPLKFAIASMGSPKNIKRILDHNGISDKFAVIMTREDVTHHKPHPEVYLKTVAALGLKPNECAVIEDTVIGAQAAISAGCKVYVLLNGLNRKEDFRGMKIEEFLTDKLPF